MLPAPQEKADPTTSSVTALLVSATEEDHRVLQGIFSHLDWTLYAVQSMEEARTWMVRAIPPPIVISDQNLPDGNWKPLFRETERLPRPPRFIVSSRTADDHLWAEVLNLGGHDVLATPFESREVLHVFSLAWESWHQQWEQTAPRKGVGAKPGQRHSRGHRESSGSSSGR